MAASNALSVVESYYKPFHSGDAAAVTAALREVLHAEVEIDSPIVQHRYGGALHGDKAIAAAAGVAPILKNAILEARYVSRALEQKLPGSKLTVPSS